MHRQSLFLLVLDDTFHLLFDKSILDEMPESPPMEYSSQCPPGLQLGGSRVFFSRSISSSQTHSHDELPCCFHLTPHRSVHDERSTSMTQILVGDCKLLSQVVQCIYHLVHHRTSVVDTETLTCEKRCYTHQLICCRPAQDSSICSHEQNPC